MTISVFCRDSVDLCLPTDCLGVPGDDIEAVECLSFESFEECSLAAILRLRMMSDG